EGLTHPGVMATAPSAVVLAKSNKREGGLIDTDPDRVPPLSLPPEPDKAGLGGRPRSECDRVGGEAARTAPPRAHGGNQAINNLPNGTRAFYPVYVDGSNFSVGHLHFSQRDAEITFCGGIQMGGFMDIHVALIKGGMETYGVS